MAGFVVVGGSSIPACVVVVPRGVRFASRALVFSAIDLLVAILVAAEASYSRFFGRGIGPRKAATVRKFRDLL